MFSLFSLFCACSGVVLVVRRRRVVLERYFAGEDETWGRALVRNLKDFSQIFYQFGLGAAALKVIKD